MLGDFEITVLSDGTVSREIDKLSNQPCTTADISVGMRDE
jgi:hypothetical protein